MVEKKYKNLTLEEQNIIIHKGTEMPFSGKYNNFFANGTYICKNCHQKLYYSKHKFPSYCGWPSFDNAISGKIKKQIDADGIREEIVCSNCNAHLGHIFYNESFTKQNVRHCVNSISLEFIKNEKTKKAYFAAGCFWGVEHLFRHYKKVKAVSGYMGGAKENPSYEDVCYNNSGHLEVVEITYNTADISYEELVKFFFEIHDPTQTNGQGPDIGNQYLSAIFYNDNIEKKTAIKIINILQNKGYKIATKLIAKTKFWIAEDYHQQYYDKNKAKPYCHKYVKKFKNL